MLIVEALTSTRSLKLSCDKALVIIVCSYVIGAGFFAAWKIEADKMAINPPNGVFNLNPIM